MKRRVTGLPPLDPESVAAGAPLALEIASVAVGVSVETESVAVGVSLALEIKSEDAGAALDAELAAVGALLEQPAAPSIKNIHRNNARAGFNHLLCILLPPKILIS